MDCSGALNLYESAALVAACFLLWVFVLSVSARLLFERANHLPWPLWWAVFGPAVLWHEICHLLVLLIFGHRIKKVDLTGVFIPTKDASVSTQYNSQSWWHRAGLFLGGWAPVWVNFILLWALKEHYAEWTVRSQAVALYVAAIMSVSMALSPQDWAVGSKGLLWTFPVWFPALVAVVHVTQWGCEETVALSLELAAPVLLVHVSVLCLTMIVQFASRVSWWAGLTQRN